MITAFFSNIKKSTSKLYLKWGAYNNTAGLAANAAFRVVFTNLYK